MTQKVIFLIVLLLLVNIVSVGTIKQDIADIHGFDQIDNLVKLYNFFMRSNWTYKFYPSSRGAELAWRTKEGDCTDMSTVFVEMLRSKDIAATVVHGTVDGERHNWVRITRMDVDLACPGCNRTYLYDGLG